MLNPARKGKISRQNYCLENLPPLWEVFLWIFILNMTETGRLFGEDCFVRRGVVVGKGSTVHEQDTVSFKKGLSATVFALIRATDRDGSLIPYESPIWSEKIKPGTKVDVYCPHLDIN